MMPADDPTPTRARKARAKSGRNPRRTLISDREIDRAFRALVRNGVSIAGFAIDIRTDGISFLPPAPQPGNDFDAWKAGENPNRGRPSRR